MIGHSTTCPFIPINIVVPGKLSHCPFKRVLFKMKLVLPRVAVILAVLVLSTQAQIGDYVLNAYNSAMAMKEIFEYNVDNFRGSLTIEAQDFGDYFTERVTREMERTTTEAQGAALSICAENAATSSRNSINRFDATLVPLQNAAMRLHLSVWEELIATNINADLDTFYYRHNQRMDASYDHLNNVLLETIVSDLIDLWLDFFDFSMALSDCIEAIFEN